MAALSLEEDIVILPKTLVDIIAAIVTSITIVKILYILYRKLGTDCPYIQLYLLYSWCLNTCETLNWYCFNSYEYQRCMTVLANFIIINTCHTDISVAGNLAIDDIQPHTVYCKFIFNSSWANITRTTVEMLSDYSKIALCPYFLYKKKTLNIDDNYK